MFSNANRGTSLFTTTQLRCAVHCSIMSIFTMLFVNNSSNVILVCEQFFKSDSYKNRDIVDLAQIIKYIVHTM